ncbi:hypothetical protein Bpfe_019237 [Biomphalaria pfeifferi]|uniref:Uncharacterized protein n=1 Tax=Biomphalaria pfeifferi TaxID=112525 RepID=A0AAD8F5Q7_BIOPF|nr:hypothetical protein Bpfe_019237 [Biomphalaria pfeifferi]
MTSPGAGRTVHDREMSAVMYNLKEQRVLEKSLQTLDLEQSYAIRLLELDNRIIKVKYKKLKEKVSKIKSYLEPDDINELQSLEGQGKLKPLYGDCSGSAIKIAAASRRLNLGNSRASSRRSVRSALPRITFHSDESDLRCRTAPERIQRSNSVTGVFIEAPVQRLKLERPATAFTPQNFNVVNRSPTPKPSSGSEVLRDEDNANHEESKKRNMVVKETALNSGRSSISRSLSASQHHQFSSHVTNDARAGLSTAPAQYNRSRRYSHMSNDSIESNLGVNIYQERRQELLEEENQRAATLEKRTKHFLQNVDTFLQKNIPLLPAQIENESLSHSTDIKANSKDPYSSDLTTVKYHRRRGMGVEFDDTPTYFPESNYKEKLMTLWKDMNKCRYLRVPDEKIDLSGINTLVKDQMKMFEKLKQADRPPLREAWENKMS